MRVVAALLAASACNEYNVFGNGQDPGPIQDYEAPPAYEGACTLEVVPPEFVGSDDSCASTTANSGFEPVVDWEAGANENCRATVAVGDLDGDGLPEVVANFSGLLPGSDGDLVVLDGADGTVRARIPANLGYGSSPALGDLEGDGSPEIIVVRSYGGDLPFGDGDYRVAAYSSAGQLVWESIPFDRDDFDYATAPILSDMDHDGLVEVVAGRVILNWDGTVRGVGAHGHGSWGIALGVSEAAVSAVADIDLDGVEEVIVGDAVYRADGTDLFFNPAADDGMIGIGNLDDDPYGEIVVSSFNTVRYVDHDGSVIWGPWELPSANITSPPAVGDIDGDGLAEVIVAGGNHVYALNHDGTTLWKRDATDMSGASGASIFDFEGDGLPEVVYIDEVEMSVFDGPTGAMKFHTREHASDTMMDYPVVADIDVDGHADIVFGHAGYGVALSAYRDVWERWVAVRPVWNQHAYFENNVLDDLSIPVDAVPNFSSNNLWHGANPGSVLLDPLGAVDLQAEIVDVCDDSCDTGLVPVLVRAVNRGIGTWPGSVSISVYAVEDTFEVLVGVVEVPGPIQPGWTSETAVILADAALVDVSDDLVAVADDDGTGAGVVEECEEGNNGWVEHDPFCL